MGKKPLGQRKLAVLKRDAGNYLSPSISFFVADISKLHVPANEGQVLAGGFATFEAARAELERLVGKALPQDQGLGWSHGRCAWFEGKRRDVLA